MTYTAYRLMVKFSDGTTRSFIASPIVAISIESALADLEAAYGMPATLYRDYTGEAE
jgi:hypothetical protein